MQTALEPQRRRAFSPCPISNYSKDYVIHEAPGPGGPGAFMSMRFWVTGTKKRKGSRRRPTLPRLHTAVPSALEGLTAGFGMDPGVSPPLWPPGTSPRFPRVIRHLCDTRMAGAKKERLRPRQISTGRLKRLHVLHLRPIYPVVSRVPYPLDAVSDLILRPASRLDAFSGYPFRT